MKERLLAVALLCILTGCVSAQTHRSAVQDDSGERVTVGTVQREISVGMSGAEVASVLGSPNMVTTDAERRETWVYDKISTVRVHSSSAMNAGGGAGGAGGGSSGGGVLALLMSGGASAGASSTSQRTLTIIIKFDQSGLVRDFSYRQSSF